MSSPVKSRKWYQVRWFQDYDTPEERKLILKLDLLIVPYVFLAYWVKYIDQANINNAYVAGMKEDLNFKGNELVRLQTMYILGKALYRKPSLPDTYKCKLVFSGMNLISTGAVLGQLPFMYLFTKIPMFYLIPFLDIGKFIYGLQTVFPSYLIQDSMGNLHTTSVSCKLFR
jgi:hypothetical protein